jgi:hypothetical protein
VNDRLHSQPDEIQRELRVVLRHGLRPARVERCLEQLPALVAAIAPNIDFRMRFDISIALCNAIEAAIRSFGDGDFGRALQLLFGLQAGTRGLNLDKRRSAAANLLGREPATIARHWEREALLDLAVELYERHSTI